MNRKGVPGRPTKPPLSRAWAWMIDDYLYILAAEGQRSTTIKVRRNHLQTMARGLDCPPDEVTSDRLVNWFGQNAQWARETRRGYRNAAKGFFTWAHRVGRVPTYIGDALPPVRQVQAPPRPASDDAWEMALATANPRTLLMVRLAGEAGLRRAEVAQVHVRDVFITAGLANLTVHGKGGKERIVPISDELAELIRRGAAGHTPQLAAYGYGRYGWLFPDAVGGHLSPEYVGEVVSQALPDGVTMHQLRHRFATKAYRGSRNILAVKSLLGHESVATTQRYTAVWDDEIRATASCAW